MVTSLTETSNQTNKNFYTNVVVLLFITKLYLKKFINFLYLLRKLVYIFVKFRNVTYIFKHTCHDCKFKLKKSLASLKFAVIYGTK